MPIIEQQPARAPDRAAGRRYRTEIDGLRALAVALVVVYHVSTARVSGGVDVFLVLSGFFLVEALSRQVDRTGQVQVLSTLTRMLSRLVPAALLVLAASVVASALVVPQTRWREIAGHLRSSVTFTENHRLVREAVDYSASNAAASPMQHFWSLSIQPQVLLVAPVVVAVGAAALRRSRLGLGRPNRGGGCGGPGDRRLVRVVRGVHRGQPAGRLLLPPPAPVRL